MGVDRVRERERAGKKGGANAGRAELPAEAVPCGLCGDPLIEGEVGDREPRGSYHVGCLKEARQETLGQRDHGNPGNGSARRRRRRG